MKAPPPNLAPLRNLDRMLTPSERKLLFKKQKNSFGGYADLPGTGPLGETCRTCKHYVRKQLAGTYLKCGLMEAVWTCGPGTDIKAWSPACSKWEKP